MLEEACGLLGLKASTGRNLIHVERFPVPHEKLGRRSVVFKDVLTAYFDKLRDRRLAALEGKDGIDHQRSALMGHHIGEAAEALSRREQTARERTGTSALLRLSTAADIGGVSGGPWVPALIAHTTAVP